jgi:hypothetical protein
VSVSQDEPQAAVSKGSHDAVLIEFMGGPNVNLEPLLAAARHAVSANGQLWLFARYDALEGARSKPGEHPLARLRRLLADAGLTCQHLNPIEADGEHVLAVVAVPFNSDASADTKIRDAKGLV